MTKKKHEKLDKNAKIALGVSLAVLVVAGGLIGAYFYSKNYAENEPVEVSTGVGEASVDGSESEIALTEGENKIESSGIYRLSGSVSNGFVTVNAGDEDVVLILDDVSITNSEGPAINVESNGNVYIYLVGENKISATPTEDLNGAIYSKADLLLANYEGENGSLEIESTLDGIVGKDDLEIDSGTYDIKASDDGIVGKDSVLIKGGTFNIEASGLGIKTSNEEEKGDLEISGGEFTIKSGGKAIKAEGAMVISGGEFNINTADDGIHANSDISITDGKFVITASDDGIHADGRLIIDGGTFEITAHEGLEATYVLVNGGEITISADDDGINATTKSADYETKLVINGGTITIKMGAGDTDALDSNGALTISGGTITITGQNAFDYDTTAEFTGGTITVNGEEVTEITNQFENGGMMQGGGRQPGRK